MYYEYFPQFRVHGFCRFLLLQSMTHRDMLQDFALIFRVFKGQHDLSTVPLLFPLNSQLSPALYSWFCAYFLKQRHKDWLELVCYMPLQRTSNHIRHLQITDESFVDMTNVALLTGLDDIYCQSLPPPQCLQPPSLPHRLSSMLTNPLSLSPACASQPVTNRAEPWLSTLHMCSDSCRYIRLHHAVLHALFGRRTAYQAKRPLAPKLVQRA